MYKSSFFCYFIYLVIIFEIEITNYSVNVFLVRSGTQSSEITILRIYIGSIIFVLLHDIPTYIYIYTPDLSKLYLYFTKWLSSSKYTKINWINYLFNSMVRWIFQIYLYTQYSKRQTQYVLFSKAKESKVQTRIIVADFGKGLELYDSIRTQLADLEIGTLGGYKREDLKWKFIDIIQVCRVCLFVCLSSTFWLGKHNL